MSNKKTFLKVTRSFQAGQVVFGEGDAWDGLYCVQSGKVSVFKTQKGVAGESQVELAQLGPGSLIGEMGLFENTRRDATVKAIEYTEILVISREMFEEQMTRIPPWMVNLFKLLSQRLRATNERLLSTTQALAVLGGTLGPGGQDAPAAGAKEGKIRVPDNPLKA